jgi:hypothetical protein
MNSQIAKKNIDFERLGYETMLATGDAIATQNICGLHIHALNDEIQTKVSYVDAKISQVRKGAAALHVWLYEGSQPVCDAAMMALAERVKDLIVLAAVVGVASLVGHVFAFYSFGYAPVFSLLLGLTVTVVATACGHQMFEKILVRKKELEAIMICAAFLLCIWGLLELNQARALMMNKVSADASAASATSSYVDDATADATPGDPAQPAQSDEQKTGKMLGAAVLKIMFAADLMLGMLLGALLLALRNENYIAWQKLRTHLKRVRELERYRNELLTVVEVAKKQCMAGILRATHTPRKRSVPYHTLSLVVLVLWLAMALPLYAQSINRHEGFLLDVSGSIGRGGANSELFREYVVAINKLLATEPPNSRVWVSVISTDSFGSVHELVRGWTPEGRGVFTDNLNRARRQLVTNFQSRAAGLAPVASGTDIIGGLWHMKAMLESGSVSGHVSKDVWIVSDMMNETAEFPMPALIPSGPDGMLKRAKGNHLVVPLTGYRIHVIGASPAGMNPYMWNTVKAFWALYFQAAGAELVSYSAEARGERE